MASVAEQLKSKHCAFVNSFVTSAEAEALAESFIDAHSRNLLAYEAPYSAYASYNYPTFLSLLVQKTGVVSKLVGEDVIPTYTYARIYKRGATLLRHTDRPACDISITLNIKQDVKWLISAEAPDGIAISFDLQPGDAMLYYGCDAPHWRESAFAGEEYVQVFMHYVRLNGPRANYYFDREF